ncbi:MAG: hypothetical protein AB8H80_19785 [Planctomycetota bacterium]
MRSDVVLAAPHTRLGQLQRGRGRGFLDALRAGPAARDDVLQSILECIVRDPRIDAQIESRARYLTELLVALDVPIDPIVQALRRGPDTSSGSGEPSEPQVQLGHEVLACAWVAGHRATRSWFAAKPDESICAAVAGQVVGGEWARLVELPRGLRKPALAFLLEDADSAAVTPGMRGSIRPPGPLTECSVDELLELARGKSGRELLRELCARGDEASRERMADCVRSDLVYGRVRLAAHALGTMGDERLLDLAREHFALEDEPLDAARRLSGFERMRRAALASYVRHLPEARQRQLAREWHERGDYFETVAGSLFAETADADDRMQLEAFVKERLGLGDSGWGVISELDALAHIGDPRSADLLVMVAEQAGYAHARRRALHGLALLASAGELSDAQNAALTEALWDCEDEAAADACAFLPMLDKAARARVVDLAASPLVDDELAVRARRRLARGGESVGPPLA